MGETVVPWFSPPSVTVGSEEQPQLGLATGDATTGQVVTQIHENKYGDFQQGLEFNQQTFGFIAKKGFYD